jgi:(+)-trans-carveol dehydrogenase
MQADAGQAGGAPSMVERGQGGSIVLTSSIAGSIAFPDLAHCTAAEHGVTGLMRTLAVARAPHRIRVDSVHPTTVDTQMVANEPVHGPFTGPAGPVRRSDDWR